MIARRRGVRAMADGETRWRGALTTIFPMFIATLSLLTAVYNGYINNKFVGIIQGNLSKSEYMRTCKEIIDAYFQVKFKAGLLAEAGGRATPPPPNETGKAVSHFAALGDHLAQLRDDAA